MTRNEEPLSTFLIEYRTLNTNGQYKPVAVGKYGIRFRESIYSKELAKDYSKNKLICKDTLTIGMGTNQIDIGVLTDDVIYSVSPAYHTYKIQGINSKYLDYCLRYRNSEMFARYVKRGSRQGKSIDLKEWMKYKIPIYTQDNQEYICATLDKILSLHDKCENFLMKMDDLVKSQFIEMFGDLITNTKHWSFDHLSKLCDVRDGTHDTPKRVELGYPLLTSKNFTDGYVNFEGAYLISETDYNLISKRSGVEYGDIVMPMIGTIGNPVIVDTNEKFTIKNVALIKFKNSQQSNIFIKSILESDYFYYYLKKCANGNTQKFLSLALIRDFQVPLVPRLLQNEFASFVYQIDKSKFRLRQLQEKLDTLYKSLLQKYFR